ncbi:Uncharacterized protein HZ326_28181 [Fusarium oxysporum f. sp. albedinis]|nr:Uncharacterized protein HZ326_28181 [Fusarium oxysporum f. sp. albedinis]
MVSHTTTLNANVDYTHILRPFTVKSAVYCQIMNYGKRIDIVFPSIASFCRNMLCQMPSNASFCRNTLCQMP